MASSKATEATEATEKPGAASRVRRWLVARRLYFLVALSFAYFHQGSDPNQTSRLGVLHAVVERHATDITPDAAKTIDKGYYRSKFYSDKAPGLVILALPVYVLMTEADRLTDLPADDRGAQRARLHTLSFVTASIPGVLATYFLVETLLLFGVARWLANVLGAGYALGTLVFPFATMMFGHVLAASLLLAAFYLIQKWRVAAAPLCLARSAALGALWATAIVVEYPTGMLVAVMGVYALVLARTRPAMARVLVGSALGAALPFAAHMIFAYVSYGTPFALPYKFLVEPVFLGQTSTGLLGIGVPTKLGLWGVFVSRYRGLFFLCPFLALVFVGFARWSRSSVPRREMWVVAASVVVYGTFTASYYAWDGGGSTGSRHIIPAIGFMVIAIAMYARSSRAAAIVTTVAVGCSVLIMYLSTSVIVQTPEGGPYETNPFYELVVSSLARGALEHNLQDAYFARSRADAAYNLGTLFGMKPMASLLVPPLLWVAAYAADLVARARRRAHA